MNIILKRILLAPLAAIIWIFKHKYLIIAAILLWYLLTRFIPYIAWPPLNWICIFSIAALMAFLQRKLAAFWADRKKQKTVTEKDSWDL